MKKINVMFGAALAVTGLLFTVTGCSNEATVEDTSSTSSVAGLKEVTEIKGGEVVPGVPVIQPRKDMVYYFVYPSDEIRDADDGSNPTMVYVPLDTDVEDPTEWLAKTASLIEEAGVYTGVQVVPADIAAADAEPVETAERVVQEMYMFNPIDADKVSTMVSTSYTSNGEAGVEFEFLEGTDYDGVITYSIM